MMRIKHWISIVTLVLAVILPLGGTARAAFPGGDGKIAFMDFFSSRIFTIQPNGSGLTAVTPSGWNTSAPSWSADGSKIAFVRSRLDGSPDALMSANADGSGISTVVPFSKGRYISSPSWSPDGSTIAYCATRAQDAVFTVHADGTALTRVTIGNHADCDPAWSPDGSSLAIATHYPGFYLNSRIVTINPDGTGRTVVLGSGVNYAPDWSPDGSHLVISRRVAGAYYDIFTVRADGTGLMDLTNSPHRHEWTPAYSPSGTRIVYSREQDSGYGPDDLWIRNADGTGRPHRLTDTLDRDEFHPSWQPT